MSKSDFKTIFIAKSISIVFLGRCAQKKKKVEGISFSRSPS